MRTFSGLVLTVALGGVLARGADPAEDAKAKVAERKKKAEANWETVGAGDFAHLETKHLLVYAPQAQEKQLKGLGGLLEKQYELAWKALNWFLSTSVSLLNRLSWFGVVTTTQPPGRASRVSSRKKARGFSRCSMVSTAATTSAAASGSGTLPVSRSTRWNSALLGKAS